MSPSLRGWARAGERRTDVKGRPGSNSLRYHLEPGPDRFDQIVDWVAECSEPSSTEIGLEDDTGVVSV
jgi:hypothetical protein